jgi:hypothetical protein
MNLRLEGLTATVNRCQAQIVHRSNANIISTSEESVEGNYFAEGIPKNQILGCDECSILFSQF